MAPDPNLCRNGILVGVLDLFCLLCESYIEDNDAAHTHIEKSSHKKNMMSINVVEKFKDDYIIKVKQGYFCVYCNEVIHTASKVNLHVAETGHKNNKGKQVLRRHGAAITYQGLLVDGSAWHGFTDEMCAVCNVEFEDEVTHKVEPTHSLNLAKKAIEFGPKKEIYRQVDNTTIQCITCNRIISSRDLSTHFDDPDHNDMIQKCAKAFLNFEKKQTELMVNTEQNVLKPHILNDCKNENSSSSEGFQSAVGSSNESLDGNFELKQVNDVKNGNKENILESVRIFEKNEINIDFITETAICKKCLNNVDFDHAIIALHIDEHKKNPMTRDFGYEPFQCEADMKIIPQEARVKDKTPLCIEADDDIEETPEMDVNNNKSKPISEDSESVQETTPKDENPAVFARQNHLTFNYGNNEAYCRLCKMRLPSTLKSMKEHVAGRGHKKLENMRKQEDVKPEYESPIKIRMEDYLLEILSIRNFLTKDKVLNGKFCITESSFHMMTMIGEGHVRCQVCEISFHSYYKEIHEASILHDHHLKNTLVLLKYDNEFIREVHREVFHCGSCNLLVGGQDELKAHCRSPTHAAALRHDQARFRAHRPALEQYKIEKMFRFIFSLQQW